MNDKDKMVFVLPRPQSVEDDAAFEIEALQNTLRQCLPSLQAVTLSQNAIRMCLSEVEAARNSLWVAVQAIPNDNGFASILKTRYLRFSAAVDILRLQLQEVVQ